MDHSIQLSDVQNLNFYNLLTIQAALRSDLVAASYKFHLDRDTANELARKSVEELRAFAASMPYESLFQPVGNFGDLMASPSALAPILCAVGLPLNFGVDDRVQSGQRPA